MKLFQYSPLPIAEQRSFLPKWLSMNSIALYVVLLLTISMAFFTYAMEWYFMLIGTIEVVGFFYLANLLTKKWGVLKNSSVFKSRLFWWAFGVRVFWVVFSYVFYVSMTGRPFDYGAADSLYYDEMAGVVADNILRGNFSFYTIISEYSGSNSLADMGFPIVLGIIYVFTGKSILFSRIVRCFIGAYTCVLIYKIGQRGIGEKVARIAAIFCMLNPLLYHYNALQLKETEMTFLVILFVERCDSLLREKHISIYKLMLVAALGLSLTMFRTVMAMVCFFALLFSVLLSSNKIVSWGKKFLLGILVIGIAGVASSDKIMTEIHEVTETDVMAQQQISMSKRYGGNSTQGKNELAKYAGAAVFAPLIFTIPFPTMVATPYQEDMRLIHSGNYIKNILSGLVIFAMFVLLLSGDWRKYTLPLSLMLGYLLVLAVSQFAHSVRFHIPIIPLEMFFAAYGLSQLKSSHKSWANYWLLLVFVANVGWAWFKLKGRGVI